MVLVALAARESPGRFEELAAACLSSPQESHQEMRSAMEETEFTLSLPLDEDGFFRRACPTCIREFKWFHSEDDDSEDSPATYFCPYCGVAAEQGEWQTEEQMRYIEEEAVATVLGPALEELEGAFGSSGHSSSGLFQISLSVDMPERRQAAPVFEPNDMRRVDFTCHPEEPVKVDEAWTGPVHCLCCREVADATAG